MPQTHDGAEAWRRDLGPFKGGHGDGVSPIVYQDLVVVPYEHNGDSALVALSRLSGKVHWRVSRKSKSSWSTPCVFRRGGKFDELIFSSWTHGITAINPKTGDISWEMDVFDKGHTESSISSPIVAGDLVLGTSGWLGVRKEVIAVRPGKMAAKNVKAERIYCIDRGAPLCTTPLVKDNLLFLWSDEGIVTCADLASGEVHWRKRIGSTFYSSPICVDNAVYNISTDGEVVVLKASSQFQELARNDLGETSYATPAVSDGVMYIRTASHLLSVGGR
ncbi:MAG: PQQ-binding-like beta-propeller repeat protein [Planctomycetes bacterium]|nr:PQQ-binding-like beta-propeller repeat protein [Planctomycetota bacterium]